MLADKSAQRARPPVPPPDLSAIRSSGRVTAASWLTEGLLLLLWTVPTARQPSAEAWLVGNGEQLRLDAWSIPFAPAPSPDGVDDRAELLLVRVPREVVDPTSLGTLVVQSGRSWIALEPGELSEVVIALEELLDGHLARTDAEARARLVEQLAAATADEERYAWQLSESLFRVREALRAHLPASVVDRARPAAAHVDAIWRIDDSAFYVEGWVRNEGDELMQLTAVAPEGRRIELADTAFRYPRPDVSEFYGLGTDDRRQKLGFIAYFETDGACLLPDGWLLEMRSSHGNRVETKMPPVITDLRVTRSTILGDLKLERPPEERLRVNHILPALTRVQQRLMASVEIDTIDQFGAPVSDPDVSIVIPLYRRIEFLEQQLAQFVHDPEIGSTDLVYVLDSPEDADYLRAFSAQLFRLYGVPFRLVTLTRNGGFSAVNNLGASVARGRLLVFLNSDVLPEKPGWLGAMTRFFDSMPQIGALSPKLLYEDDSIQHAGLYFDRPPGEHVWSNEHYFKGLHRTLPAANVTRPVPAVTGACLMTSSGLYREHGGLRGIYVQGDYEDTDLCLRLSDAGYECWYLPEVALYHLEGQSYPAPERELSSEYNKWLHTHLWRDKIGAVMAGLA